MAVLPSLKLRLGAGFETTCRPLLHVKSITEPFYIGPSNL